MINNLILIGLILCFSCAASAADASIWSVNSRPEVLRGDARDVSIDSSGNITLAPRISEIFKTEQPYVWSSASDAAGGIYLGTGGDGKIFKIAPNGNGSLFADLNELNVSALAVSAGSVFAATSPDGKVYKIDGAGNATVYFEPKEKYIWSLAVLSDGSLAVGTGENGRIYKVRAANSPPEASVFFDTSETHITTLVADREGNLIAGTDSSGLVLKLGPDGKPFALLDSRLREIHQLALGPDGSIYVLALGESAAVSPSPAPAAPAATEQKTSVAEPAAAAASAAPPKSRYDLSGAKSAVYRIMPDGTDLLWTSSTVTAFSIYPHQTGAGVLIGTSDKGRIYNVDNDGRETLVLQTDANQISTIRGVGSDLYAASSNPGRLFRIGGSPVTEGVYRSPVLDAKSTATWGRLWWRAMGNVTFQTRSGNTETANETWSAWTDVSATGGGRVASPPARYFQWRAVLRSGPTAPNLTEINLAYLPRNIAPEVLSISILPTNVGLVANPTPAIDPNIEESGLPPSAFGLTVPAVQPRRVYQRGARSLQWTAEDRNGDRLVFDVYYKEAGEQAFRLVKQNLLETFTTLDGNSLADGRYTIKIVAKDVMANPAGISLAGERISEPFDIDNTQPVAVAGAPQTSGEAARITFTATDRASYVARAEYSINGGDWQTVYADDGISDSPSESYTIDLIMKNAGDYSVTLRVFDASGNVGNARALIKR